MDKYEKASLLGSQKVDQDRAAVYELLTHNVHERRAWFVAQKNLFLLETPEQVYEAFKLMNPSVRKQFLAEIVAMACITFGEWAVQFLQDDKETEDGSE